MITLICSILILFNSSLLFVAIGGLGTYFIFYFLITQGVLSWLLIDEIVIQKNRTALAPAPSVEKLPPNVQVINTDPSSSAKINFEMKSSLKFTEKEVEASWTKEKFEIIEAAEKNQTGSQLEIIDELIKMTPGNFKTLLVTNLYSFNKNPKDLSVFFNGNCLENEVLCHNISKNTDLIPHIGDLETISPVLLKSYFNTKSDQYQKIIFNLSRSDIKKFNSIFGSGHFEHEIHDISL